ncbi:arylamine N-acetyltransferase [Dyella solisilvae]|uniref:Arylamine N-acetyltransferase n=1 Tax=Dyella solisilvae TaxID=1920168 RepID=A0A370K6G0_9GAMM|nr:arylamine N-acetyltransferase [Dyella solisilvae]RDI98231.1 arylamine N-acetyltransferase [Dyella solisilvae]
MTHVIDLNAYLRRIGHDGPLTPGLDTLRALTTAHVAAIPFENLDPLLRVPVSLEPEAIERKLVRDGRGGYCFEQNGLLLEVLRTLGFQVHGLIARVLWMKPEDAMVAQTHMLLRVELEGESWLVDVGFGSMALSGALRLQPDIEQATGNEPFRLLEGGGDWRMQALVRGEWKTLYRFDLQPRPSIDYVVANHYTSTYPDSHFLHGLIAARTLAGRRLGLRNREFVVHPADGESVRRTLDGVEEIKQVLREQFDIRLPAHPELDRTLAALPLPSQE